MEIKSNDYIINGGEKGKSRLNVLSEVLRPYTRSLLEANGLMQGTKLLDLGCGGGNVTIMAAEIAGEEGRVTGIDFDETIITLARKEAAEKCIRNISFEAGSITAINYEEEFDIVYARFLLSHLEQPAAVMQRMVESVRKGGRVVAEDVHFTGHYCYPQDDAFDTYLRYYDTAAKRGHQNPDIGPALFRLFQKAGLKDVGFDTIQPSFSSGPGKWMAYITLDNIKEKVVAQGITDMPTVLDTLDRLKRFTEDERSIISLPRIFRVWGRRD